MEPLLAAQTASYLALKKVDEMDWKSAALLVVWTVSKSAEMWALCSAALTVHTMAERKVSRMGKLTAVQTDEQTAVCLVESSAVTMAPTAVAHSVECSAALMDASSAVTLALCSAVC